MHDEVLDTAVAAFLEYGIKRTSMADIAKRAGISSATLYRRFAGKNELVQAFGLRELARVLDGLEQQVDRNADGTEQVVQFCTAVLLDIQAHALFQRLIKSDPEILLPLMTVESAAFLPLPLSYVTGIITDLQGQGKLPPFSAAPVAEMVVRLVVSFGLLPDSHIPLHDRDGTAAMIRATVTAFVKGLEAG